MSESSRFKRLKPVISPEQLEKSLRQDLTKDPDDVNILRGLGLAIFKQQRYREAIDYLSRAVEQGLRDPGVYAAIGKAYLQMGDLRESEKMFNRALELESECPEAVIGLSIVLVREGKNPEAKPYLEMAARLDCSDSLVYETLAEIYYEDQEYDQCVGICNKGMSVDMKNRRYPLLLAKCYLGKDDLVTARNWLRQATDADPQNAEAHRLHGDILAQQGRLVEARQEYEVALGLSPGSSDLVERIEEIERYHDEIEYETARKAQPILQADKSEIRFDGLSLGTLEEATIDIDNVGGGINRGTITSDSDWITIDPAVIDPKRHKQSVIVTIATRGFEHGRRYRGTVEIKSEGGNASVSIIITTQGVEERVKTLKRYALGTAISLTLFAYIFLFASIPMSGSDTFLLIVVLIAIWVMFFITKHWWWRE